ncbi:hypothetical protein A2U01_0115727, partial [Trifolium medium]|nr:hypothetical protein [Trifolium medium]
MIRSLVVPVLVFPVLGGRGLGVILRGSLVLTSSSLLSLTPLNPLFE